MAADALFREYLLMQFPNYCKEAKEELKYQAEYLISGKPSDQKNLKYVVKRLLFLREGLNYQYCLQHQNLTGAAGEFALALTGMFGNAGADRSDAACAVAWTGLRREPAGCPDPAVRREDSAF